MSDKWGNLRRVAVHHRGPLAAIPADEAVEIFKSHADRPLVERPGLTGLIGRSIVILSEPGGAVPVLQQNAANRSGILWQDTVVAGEAGCLLRDHAKALRVVIAAGDQGGARRRAQR